MKYIYFHYDVLDWGELKMPYVSEKYAEFVLQLEYTDLPEKVRFRAKQLIMDTLGCAIVGSRTLASRIVKDYVFQQNGKPESTVICANKKVPAHYAMLVNGAMSHADDFDDIHHCSATHPSGVLLPATLAMAEKLGKTGKDIITSFVAGYEVMVRIGEALVPENHYARGFHPTCTTGTFGAACTIGKLYELNKEKIIKSLGIAGSFSSGLLEFLQDGSMVKRVYSGIAAFHGCLAVELAKLGFTGPNSIIEGKRGFLHAFTDNPNMIKLDEGLGEEYKILKTHIKLFACNGAFQSAIEALLNIIDKNNINAEEIEKITVGTAHTASTSFDPYNPKSPLDASQSLPYTLAVAAFEKNAGIAQYTWEKIKNPKILKLARKVKVFLDPELVNERREDCAKLGSKVTVKTRDGKVYTCKLSYHADGPGNWKPDKVELKFINNCSVILGEDIAKRILNKVKELEKIDDLSELTSLLSKT